ncbi:MULTISPECIES: hypothetical protein [unclassified Streptomyces]|uniref:hypothetical protein n=1 Tax=unclassified Streptomyces TaxID=2593676 RepID=UPI0004C80FD5|nr:MULTISPECIES: hypothetical protein [unclassified Streptomyces]KOV76198.1 hypothetical protein ADL02_31925 [Streptomyces sp. NRRL WC-3723]
MTTKSGSHEPGRLLYDPATDRVGEYRDRAGPYVMLRPVGGGVEREADPERVRPATDRERLGAGVRAANQRARTLPALPPPLDDAGRPPRPVPGCAVCLELAERRETARVAYDRSAETDANVLLRQHQRKEHRA